MLYVVATPIGNWGDITDRARQILKECDIVIGEEHRVTSTLLKKIGVGATDPATKEKPIYLLNEHSKPRDIQELCDLCAANKVALVSDCGTPGFADPGPALIKLCRARKIPVTALPGASALTTLLSLTSEPIQSFVFFGFLPRENERRTQAVHELTVEKRAWIIMETPYRYLAVLEQLAQKLPQERAILALNLTQESELVIEGSFTHIFNEISKTGIEKAEFILLKYPRSAVEKNKNR